MRRKVKVKRVEERVGKGGKEILLAEMEKEGDKEELLEKRGEIKSKWEVIVDEDLTMEERRLRWRMVEKARMEKRKGRKEVINNRKIWIEIPFYRRRERLVRGGKESDIWFDFLQRKKENERERRVKEREEEEEREGRKDQKGNERNKRKWRD